MKPIESIPKELIDRIVEEVFIRLRDKMKKATVLFTGGAYGFQESIVQIRHLLEDGWDLKVLLTKSAEHVLTAELIQKELGGLSSVYVERDVKGLKPYYDGISVLIIPTLTLNTAVKISLGLADNMATNLVSHAIMKGIPIIAAKNGCDLLHPIREEMKLHRAPASYKERMDGCLQTLESYGIKLIETGSLYKAVRKQVISVVKNEKKQAVTVPGKIFNKRVLTRIDIIDANQKAVNLHIPASTIVSPLAAETAKELGVEIIKA